MMSSDDTETKIANIPPFGLRMQPELRRRVEAVAKANGRSLNSEIVARLERSLREDGGGKATESAADFHEKRLRTIEWRISKLEDRLKQAEP